MTKRSYPELYRGKYEPIPYDDSWREPMWERVFREAGGDGQAEKTVLALKEFYTMYTDDLVRWFANLYDPNVGGYYCTTSGKENEGFVPDIESTRQMLDFIESMGFADHAGKDYRNVIPDEMKEKLVAFAKRLQEPNGFFYHLMKTREMGDSHLPKRGRDLSWATKILRGLGASPTYDTPNGMKGDGIDWMGRPVSNYQAREGDEPTAIDTYAEYLENSETLAIFLDKSIDICGKFYAAGNALNATYSQIKARDEALAIAGKRADLCDTLIGWLNAHINPESGYCSPTVGLAGTNGFFKVITIYNSWGYPYPAIERATESVISVISSDEETPGNSCSVYNLWDALGSVRYNALRCQPEDKKERVIGYINERLRESAPEMILKSYSKQSAFQKPDGSFGHKHEGNPTHHQGNIPTGLGIDEGNSDAISRCTMGILAPMFRALGLTPVPIFGEREWRIYEDILKNAKPVYKNNTTIYR